MTSTQPNYPSSPLGYTHLHLIDTFYGSDHDKIRVTRDEKTGTVTACVRKIRLGSLNIYSPKRAADWRISVNVEVDGVSFFRFYLLPVYTSCALQYRHQLAPRRSLGGKTV